MSKLVLLELNEINFDYIKSYIKHGKLPNFKKLINNYGIVEKTSEDNYEELEPWIQWVSLHTGKTLAEHGVFRLGDIVNTDIEQIWEKLEREKGLSVGAISPINAKNNLKNASFFIPDPWTETKSSGTLLDQLLAKAVSQVVNENSSGRMTLLSILSLLLGVLRYARPKNYPSYFMLAIMSMKKHWYKAMFLDLFLSDIYLSKIKKNNVDFSSLFLNAGAHIQHHYMFSSKVYNGDITNPEWYIPKSEDPVFEVYSLYDKIVGQILKKVSRDSRIMIATGLHQNPYPDIQFYYRLTDHHLTLKKLGVDYTSIQTLMSRDFIITFRSEDSALKAEAILKSCKSLAGDDIFYTDNRGTDLFVMLVYGKEILEGFQFEFTNGTMTNFDKDVSFVAIKNGGHNGVGYLIDTGHEHLNKSIPIVSISKIIESNFKVSNEENSHIY